MSDAERETLKGGRYVLLGPFAEGARGKTYDAVDKREGRAAVVKRLDVRGAKTWKDVELGEREVNVLRALSHPRLPAYFDHFEEDGALYLVMEKIEGESLSAMKRAGRTLSEGEVRRFLSDAADVLGYLHRRTPPVIHRDIKPGNVIRRPDGSYAFVDFGAVRDTVKPEGGSTVVGTFGYMAPEQFQGRALPASDVYAVGATALTMLTGTEPEDLPHKGLAIDVRAALKGRASADLVEILERMLQPDPDQRAGVVPRFDPRRDETSKEPKPPKTKRERRDEKRDEKREKKDEKREKKEQRRAKRDARRAARVARARGNVARARRPPFPVSLLFALGMTIGIVAVAVATKAVAALVLRLLSVFFARDALRRAAMAVDRAGDVAMARMQRTRAWMAEDEARVRVQEEEAEERVRIADADANADASADVDANADANADENEDADADASVRRRRAL
jgi:serine/threonine protein kinase